MVDKSNYLEGSSEKKWLTRADLTEAVRKNGWQEKLVLKKQKRVQMVRKEMVGVEEDKNRLIKKGQVLGDYKDCGWKKEFLTSTPFSVI